jgi:hypothetical protein
MSLRSILLLEVISCIIEVVAGKKKELLLPEFVSPANRIEKYSVMWKVYLEPIA